MPWWKAAGVGASVGCSVGSAACAAFWSTAGIASAAGAGALATYM